ncbi:MAG: hypothetical protein NC400_09540 [Clostridium sp.]|nr:hypothetical protein [Clostridium sp.]
MNKKLKNPALLILLAAFTLSSLLSGPAAAAAPSADAQISDAATASDKEAIHISDAIIASAEDAIHISTAADFLQFAKDCTDDIWSQGKIFVLDSDIELSGIDFSPVPTFGGIFLGQGHTISGFALEGGSNDMGLFRYVQESGEIYQLSVAGNAEAEKSHSGLALLAGCNRGLLSGCFASGNVNGGSQIGAIAGRNELTGVIDDCQSDGAVNGNHLVGGIAGQNNGSIVNCTNHSFVNTTPDDNKIDLSALNILSADETLTDLLTTENAASVTDIGGIAGNNAGVLRACTNEGSVGYPHVGYNIGGIAGSQTGYLEGCVNYGTLNGRKDIGGIAGQMEPSSELEFSEDTLAKLDTEFDKLHDLLTRLDDDAKGSSSALTGQIDQLLNSVDGARYAIDEIIINAGNHIEDFSQLTDLASLPSPEPVSLDFLDELKKLPTPSFIPLPSGTSNPSGEPSSSSEPNPSGGPIPSDGSAGTPSGAPTDAPTAAPTGSADKIINGMATGVQYNVETSAQNNAAADAQIDAATGSAGGTTNGTEAGMQNNTAANIQNNTATGVQATAPAVPTQIPAAKSANKNTGDANTTAKPSASDAENGVFVPEALWAAPPTAGPLQKLAENDAANGIPAQQAGIKTKTTAAVQQIETETQTGTAAQQIDAETQTGTPTPTPTKNPFISGWPEGLPMPTINVDLSGLRDSINREEIEADINDVQENIYEDASHVLDSIRNTVQNQASVLSARIFSAQNSLSSSFSSIISDTRTLNSLLDNENQILLDDIQAIIDEIHVITNIITEPDAVNPDEILADVSDEDSLTDTTGKVMNCINNGKINGDLNVGGIAGTLSRENNLDPENDLNWDRNNATLNFRYKERIVVRECQNTGAVEGKKDCVGGIAGEMVLGSIIDCLNSGNIASDGSMVGGIAGYSASTIRSSSAKCSLSGQTQIGGIAGYGKNLSGCYSMVTIQEGESYLGSIAGKADSNADISGNYFVKGCPAGIDGVSYHEKAEPLSYEEFTARTDLPNIFQQIYLTFTADDVLIETVPVNYGENLHPDMLPVVPQKDGYAGRWEDFDMTDLSYDREIKAIYTEYTSTLESSQTIGERPVVLLEGRFAPEDSFTLMNIDAYPADAQTKAQCWKITLSSSFTGPYTVRCLIPTDMENPKLELYENGSWQPIDADADGSYYVFASENADIIFSCVDRPQTMGIGAATAIALCLAAIIGVALILIRCKKHHKNKEKL